MQEMSGRKTSLLPIGCIVILAAALFYPALSILSTGFQTCPEFVMVSGGSIDDTGLQGAVPISMSGGQALAADSPTPPLLSGLMDPTSVEQTGFTSTGNVSARTDTMVSTSNSLTIDSSNDWVASELDLSVWDLQRLYVINGTFNEGIPGTTISPNGTLESYPLGWSATSTSTDDDQVQRVAYDDSGTSYVSVQNQAEITNNPQHIYTHYAGTTVLWNQTLDISPYTENFLLRFSYLYLQGPIGVGFPGTCSIHVFLNQTSVWSVNLPSLSGRGIWFDSGDIPVNIALASGRFDFQIGLVIDSTMVLDGDDDYNGDSVPDGIINAEAVTVYFDDVSLIGSSLPACEDVGLTLNVDGSSVAIVGSSGSGTSSFVNDSYWSYSLSFSLSADSAVSFDYSARLRHHRFLNSSGTTNINDDGVSYVIETEESARLEVYTYLGFLGVYDDLIIRIYHPHDWQNATVYDPFLSNVTSFCSVEADYLEVSNDVLDRLGWWKATFDSPNYASGIDVERYDAVTPGWIEDTVFHTNDSIRGVANISSWSEVPFISDPVLFTWFMPNCTAWGLTEISTSPVESPSLVFGSSNTTAGEWCITYFWTNGSEIAYGMGGFALHHSAILDTLFGSVFETVVGQPVTVVVTLYDSVTGRFIIDGGAEVVGNWSHSDIHFTANLVANWWQADFDTVDVGAGDFTVVITSAAAYYETDPIFVTIRSQFLTDLDAPTGPLLPLTYSREYTFDFFYAMSLNGTGIPGAEVTLSEEGAQWASVEDVGTGEYRLSVTPLGIRDYSIRLTFWKEGYEEQSFVLNFLVERVRVHVSLVGALIGTEELPFTVRVNVTESDTGLPIENATVTLGVYPQVGAPLEVLNMTEGEPGIYSASIQMPRAETGNFEIRVSVEKENYELEETFSASLLPTVNGPRRLWESMVTYSTDIGLILAVAGAVVVGRRSYIKRKKARNAAAMEFKRRFDDANNLLGFIVLHRLSGVPVYSKILKGGFEEGMLSAFITAIMHFREEIEAGTDAGEYAVMPVSDIIRTVATKNLICAFITVTSPSMEQERKMKEFARAVAMMLDEGLAERPARVVDQKTAKTFEWMFDEFMDGALVKAYKLGETSLPKRLRCIEKATPQISENGSFRLVHLLRMLMDCGYGESEAYLLVQEAVDAEHVVPARDFDNSIHFSDV